MTSHFNEEYECPECASTKPPNVKRTLECTDADGNRGIWVTWAICVDCENEEGFYSIKWEEKFNLWT